MIHVDVRHPIYVPGYHYDPRKKTAILDEQVRFTGFRIGYSARIHGAELFTFGCVVVAPGFKWDFGSGPTVNDSAMIYASLFHDVLVIMTKEGLVPWSLRKDADKHFRLLLGLGGASIPRQLVSYAAVRLYSMTVGRLTRKKYRGTHRG